MKIKHNILSVFNSALLLTTIGIGIGIMPDIAHSQDGFYIGIHGGQNWTSNGTSDTSVAGSGFGGFLSDIDGDQGSLVGGAIGYRFSDLLRVDVSYSRFENHVSWQGNFPGPSTTQFSSDTVSDVWMLNGALHAKGMWPERFDRLDPFISAGIGYVRNSMENVLETNSFIGGFVSNPFDGDSEGVAYRFGVGVDYEISPSVTLTTLVDANWLGGFTTGNFRSQPPLTPAMGPWKIDDMVAVGVSIGLRFSF